MRKLAAIVGSLFLLLGPAAHADELFPIPRASRYVEGWNLEGYARDGKLDSCSMYARYIDGMVLQLGIEPDYAWDLSWSQTKGRFTKGETIDFSLRVDKSAPLTVRATATTEQSMIIEMPQTYEAYQMVQHGHHLSLEADEAQFNFDLDGIDPAFVELIKCVERYTPDGAERNKAKPLEKLDEVTVDQRFEEGKVIAGLFARGDMAGFRVMNAREIFYLENDYLNDADMAWRGDDLLLTIRVVPGRISPSALTAAAIEQDKQDCRGKLESGSTTDEHSPAVARPFTYCSEPGRALDTRYMIVPARDGTNYMFATMGRIANGSPPDRAVKAASILRQAIYEVMKQ